MDMIDVQSILEQVDRYFEENKGEEAERLMQQAVAQAVQEQDDNALLQLLNELLGYYRETGQEPNALSMAEQAVAQAERMGLQGTVPYGTTLLNVASAYRVFGRLQESMDFYGQVQKLYQELLEPDSMFMAGLKNNMALLYQEMGDFAQAKQSLLEALHIVEENRAAYETGVSYANLASTCIQLGELEEARGYAEKSMEVFRGANVMDNHYAAAQSAMGAYFFRKGDFGQAAEYYGQALATVEKCVGRNGFYDRLQENLTACQKAMGEPVPKKEGLGLLLAREYYEKFGRQMIERDFPAYGGRIAVGLAGGGSDCFGYDDEASRDHDWGPDFCMWVTDQTYDEIGEALQQAYEQLPGEFRGYRRALRVNGRGRRGVIRISDFYRALVGAEDYDKINWRQVSDAGLAAAVNGEVFRDDEGIFSAFRRKLKEGYPPQIRYLKLAESAARFSQTLQYNYPRMLGRGDRLSAQMLAWEGMGEAMRLQHYIEGKYPPHDKWLHKGLQETEEGRTVAGMLAQVARGLWADIPQDRGGTGEPEGRSAGGVPQDCGGAGEPEGRSAGGAPQDRGGTGEPEGRSAGGVPQDCSGAGEPEHGAAEGIPQQPDGVREPRDRQQSRNHSPQGMGEAGAADSVQRLAEYFAMELYGEGFISDTESYLDVHSEELVYKASLGGKSREQLAGEIARLEFEAFDKVKNMGGRASCQDDWGTFSIMRKSQYLTWNKTMLMQYIYDFNREYSRGHNLIEEKYGRMMESTDPAEYDKIKGHFPVLTPEKKAIIEQIVGMQVRWMEEFAGRYPALAGNARRIHTWEDDPFDTSYETYLRGELGTYSDKMLELYGRYVVEYARSGKNPAYDIMENSVKMYGYTDMEEAEREVAAQ